VGIYTCIRSLSGGVAGVAAWGVSSSLGTGTQAVVFATLAAAVVAEPLDVAFAAVTLRLRGGRGADVVKALGPVTLASIPSTSQSSALGDCVSATLALDPRPLLRARTCRAQRLFALYQASANSPKDYPK